MPRVDLSTPTYRRLLRLARSFDDTAEDVVRRLVDAVDERGGEAPGGDEPGGPDARFGKRATPGSILPEREYWWPILESVRAMGGTGQANAVIDDVGDRMRGQLTPGDYETLKMGEVRWRNRVRFARLRMAEQGLLDPDSPRGKWKITEAGRRFLEERAAGG